MVELKVSMSDHWSGVNSAHSMEYLKDSTKESSLEVAMESMWVESWDEGSVGWME